jgi:hypothetical protein
MGGRSLLPDVEKTKAGRPLPTILNPPPSRQANEKVESTAYLGANKVVTNAAIHCLNRQQGGYPGL